LIKEYEEKQTKKKKNPKKEKEEKLSIDATEGSKAKPVGFEFGDTVDTVLGAKQFDGELNLFCSWVGRNDCSYVPAKVANLKVPQKIIAFYESRLRFEPPPSWDESGNASKKTKRKRQDILSNGVVDATSDTEGEGPAKETKQENGNPTETEEPDTTTNNNNHAPTE